MKMKVFLAVGVVILTTAATSVLAQTRTFRTPSGMEGVIQATDIGGKPAYDFEGFAGHDLVNLALGTPLGTLRTNEVLALDITCDSTGISLVVFDRAASSNLATIATSTTVDVVQQQDNDTTAFANRERFVTQLTVPAQGTSSNGLAGGFLTAAGRIHLNPTNGCARAVLVDTDRRQDKICGDPTTVKDTDEKDRLKLVAGRAHFIGVLDMVSLGKTNTVLVPVGTLSINRQLAP